MFLTSLSGLSGVDFVDLPFDGLVTLHDTWEVEDERGVEVGIDG